MDIIIFTGPDLTTPKWGVIADGITSIMWIERYRTASEFTIKGPVSSNLHEQMPVGCLISHIDSDCPMIVENHEISETNEDAEPEIVITGRSFETILENRVVGMGIQAWTPGVAQANPPIFAGAGFPWEQAQALIYGDTDATYTHDPNDVIPNVMCWIDEYLQYVFDPALIDAYSAYRTFQIGNLYQAVLDLLASNNIGFTSTWRPWTRTYLFVVHYTTMRFHITYGTDHSSDIHFSNSLDDLKSADYLWSNKNVYNCAIVQGRWATLEIIGPSAPVGVDRRYMLVDGSEIDNAFTSMPAGGDLTTVSARMLTKGTDALLGQKDVALAQAQLNPDSKRYLYRKDYIVGDYVTLDGDYDQTRKVQIVEYVEIDDATGESGYPTFAPA